MDNSVSMERNEGTPQGAPLSPLLANVLLDEVVLFPSRGLFALSHSIFTHWEDGILRLPSSRKKARPKQGLASISSETLWS